MDIDKLGNIFNDISKYKVLFTYKDEKNSKNYVVYTDNSKRNDGTLNTYAAIYNPDNFSLGLEPIKDKKEWKILMTILESIQNGKEL